MKRIGYIHRYSSSEKKGILVYGYNKGPLWNSPLPILFTKKQCKSKMKTGMLVYFDIDSNNIVSNIEQASIFNFDRDLLLSIVSAFDSKDMDEYKKKTYIRYQDISKLEEWFEYEKNKLDTETLGSESADELEEWFNKLDIEMLSSESEDELDLDITEIYDFFELEFFDDDNKYSSKGEYRRITLPDSIDEEFSLFGMQFNESETISGLFDKYEDYSISIDILDPNFWIPKISKSRKNYYGKNDVECIDLFDLLVYKRRWLYKYSQNDCVSSNWAYLLNRLSDNEIKNVLSNCALLQPILPESFCERNIDVLSEHYGFPSIRIADCFLSYQIRSIRTASEFCHIKDQIRIYKKCRVKHLPAEGIPFCAIGKERLNILSKRISRRLTRVTKYILYQVTKADPKEDLNRLIEWDNIDLVLKVGRFFDMVDEFIESDAFMIVNDAEKIVSEYRSFPVKIRSVLDSYLSNIIKEKLRISILKFDVSPFELHRLNELFSMWINENFIQEFSEALFEKYSKDIDNLKNAYEYHFISEDAFVEKYLELSVNRSVIQCVDDLLFHCGYVIPEKIQMYVLRLILEELGFHQILRPSYKDQDYICYEYTEIDSIYDFLQWMKEKNKNKHISDIVHMQFQDEIFSKISTDECWYLFEKNLIYTPGSSKIKEILSEAYSNLKFEKKWFSRDCFQSQMARDVLMFSDSKLITLTIDKLNQKYRDKIAHSITGFGKVYLWALNPNSNLDFEEIKKFFIDLPLGIQYRTFRYMFKLLSDGKIDIDILQFFTDIYEIQDKRNLASTNEGDFYWIINSKKNISSALYTLVVLLSAKSRNPDIPIKYYQNAMGATTFNIGWVKRSMLYEIQDFFEVCRGWLLFSYETRNPEYFSRNGYVEKVSFRNLDEYKYRVSFYEEPLDVYGDKIEYLNSVEIEKAESVLKRNFYCVYDNGSYLIRGEDEIRLKEYVIEYGIDDNCELFEDTEFGSNLSYHTNYPTRYKENDSLICNCGLYKDIDPSCGIPFRWCKKFPCTRRFTFLRSLSEWENFKFADFLWILLKDKISLEKLWTINSEISSFINKISKIKYDEECILESKLSQKEEEVGEWTSDMSILSYESCENYNYYETEEPDECYKQNTYDERDTYDKYNGSWAQDVEGYSDDDIDTIFDGDPDAYWNID